MKLPKEIRTYCSHCNKHTIHRVNILSVSHKRRAVKGRKRQNTQSKRAWKVLQNPY